MLLSLYSKQYGIDHLMLPEDHEGKYSLIHHMIPGKNQKLLQIDGDGQRWLLRSTSKAALISDGVFRSEAELSTGWYAIQMGEERFVLFCENETQLRLHGVFRLPSDGVVTIGYSDCDINYPLSNAIGSTNSLIWRDVNGLTLEHGGHGNGTYLNSRPVTGKISVGNGDLYELFGLRITFVGDYIAIAASGTEVTTSAKLRLYVPEPVIQEQNVADMSISDDVEYFDRSPRICPRTEIRTIEVDPPPIQEKREEMPLLLTMGTSATMSISSIMMATMALQNAQNSGRGFLTAVPSLFMSASMFVGGMVMPIVTRKYMEKSRDAREKKRRERYLAYIEGLRRDIVDEGEQQKKLLLETYRDPKTIAKMVENADSHIWERMPSHHDFLHIRLGLAIREVDVKIQFPKQSFSVEDDVLRDAMSQFREEPRETIQTPLMLSLPETRVLGIWAEKGEGQRYVKGLLLQLCAAHSYQDLKLVLIYNERDSGEWEFARWLPHTWSDNGELHTIGTDVDAMRILSTYIDSFCGNATNSGEKTHCVVVVSDAVLRKNCYMLEQAMLPDNQCAISVIAVAEQVSDLPKECRDVVALNGGHGLLYHNIQEMNNPIPFELDSVPEDVARAVAVRLGALHLSGQDEEHILPNAISFYDLMRVGNVTQLNVLNRWNQSNPVDSLAVPLGVDRLGEMLTLDIHQNAHGPHGLVAGMTGSGKSELIITYVLSMCVHFSPLEVGFILIDYKGGGMSDTLKQLPHVVGVIDNLGGRTGIHRSMVSIKAELTRRQRVFKETGERLNMSNLDIYKYQKLYREGKVEQPMQHLILISDEFAELKQQEPDFMDDLVSTARIGRSLGVHLILATQKPSGVVGPQIVSNSRFRICMKVQDRSDSMEMLQVPDAAALVQTGRFYLQVGFHELFTLGQSAWSGAPAEEKERYVEEKDMNVEILDDTGRVLIRAQPPKAVKNGGRIKQVDRIVEYIRSEAVRNRMIPEPVWLKPLSQYEHITLEWLEKTYKVDFERFALDPVIALTDDPELQRQYPLQLEFGRDGNALLYGAPGSGTETFIQAVILSACRHHTADELNVYCLDFAAETCRMFVSLPQVGDVMVSSDDEKIHSFMDFIEEEMSHRRVMLSQYAGNIDACRADNAESIPNILIVIENYTAMEEIYDDLTDRMYTLARECSRYGIYMLLTVASNNALRYRMVQNFRQVYCLQLADAQDYSIILGRTGGTEPANRRGSGIYMQDRILEFQVGAIVEDDYGNLFSTVRAECDEIAHSWLGRKAPRVPVLPKVVTVNDICAAPENISLCAVPIGMDQDKKQPVEWNLAARQMNFVLWREAPDFAYERLLADMLSTDARRTVLVLDAKDRLKELPGQNYRLYQGHSLADGVDATFEVLLQRYKEIKNQEIHDNAQYAEYVVVIIGLGSLYERMPDRQGTANLLDRLDNMFIHVSERMKITFVVFEDSTAMNTLRSKTWYSMRFSGAEGLWVGSGFSDQFLLRSETRVRIRNVEPALGLLIHHGQTESICRVVSQ